MAEEAVLETPVVETTETVIETPAKETTETIETTDKSETTEKVESKDESKETTETKPVVNAELSARAKSAVDKVGELFDALKKYAGTNVLSKEAESEINAVKEFITELAEGKASPEVTAAQTKEITDLKSEVAAVEASDKLLYATDRASHKTLAENIRTDIQNENGDLAAYHDFVGAVIDDLKTADFDAYSKAIAIPAFKEALETSHMVRALSDLVDAVNTKNDNAVKDTLQRIVNYVDKVIEGPAAGTENAKSDTKIVEQQTAINTEALSAERSIFSKLALPLFKTNPALKALDDTGKQDFSKALLREYTAQLKADPAYQNKMSSLWKDPVKNKAALLSTHTAKVKAIAQGVIDKVIKARYPKSVTSSSSAATYIQTPNGKALWLTKVPSDLDMTRADAVALKMVGRGYRQGSKQLVAWKRPVMTK